MADVSFIRGGTPVVRYMWCEGDYPQFLPPHSEHNILKSPPYDAHSDGAYNLGYFTLGMPFRPNGVGMFWQRDMLRDKNPQVDDIIDLIAVPEDHFVTGINFKIVEPDPQLAGCTVALTARAVSYDEDSGSFTFTEISDVEDAVTAQAITAPIPVDKPYNAFVSLSKVVGGYAVPLYAKPTLPPADDSGSLVPGRTIYLGLKIVSLPSNSNVKIWMAQNGWYLSAKTQAFECPTHY